jgi:hypothetical protein
LESQALYAKWLRPASFATAMGTNLDDLPLRQELVNVGAQVDLRLMLLSILKLTLSTGYAVAMGEDRRPENACIFSIQIL